MKTQTLILWIFVTVVMLIFAWPIAFLMIVHMCVYLVWPAKKPGRILPPNRQDK